MDISRPSFKTGPGGERLFCPNGPFGRPYIVPDASTEQRLASKQRLLWWTLFGVFLVGQQVVYAIYPKETKDVAFFVFVTALVLASWLAGWFVYREELGRLERLPHRLPLREHFSDMTYFSLGTLGLGLLACLLFVAAGLWLALSDRNVLMGWLCTGFFALAAFAWAYAFWLKLTGRPSIESSRP